MRDPDAFLELVSKIRYELLNSSREIISLRNLFRYFNEAYQDLSGERDSRLNPAIGLKNKTGLGSGANKEINALFEQVFELIHQNSPIEKNASADLMLLYSIGLNVVYDEGIPNQTNKALFFKKIIHQYNEEFHSQFSSLENFSLSSRRDNSDWEESLLE